MRPNEVLKNLLYLSLFQNRAKAHKSYVRRGRLLHLSAWNEGLIPAGKDPLGSVTPTHRTY
ncbi:MAG: hypothetical protein LBK61_07485 [Spirochaetaceae bacterium]|nr:hypothetical protein [Spirochaetaceae bacterium]